MRKNTKIVVTCLSALLILGVAGGLYTSFVKDQTKTQDNGSSSVVATSVTLSRSSYVFGAVGEIINFEAQGIPLNSSYSYVWACENTTDILLTPSKNSCVIKCLTAFTGTITVSVSIGSITKNISLTYVANTKNVNFVVCGYLSDTGVDGVYNSSNSITMLLPTNTTLATLKDEFLKTYPETGYTFSESKSSLNGYTCDLYFYKGTTSTPVTNYKLNLNVYLDGNSYSTNSSNHSSGSTLNPRDYWTYLYGDLDENHKVSYMVIDGTSYSSYSSVPTSLTFNGDHTIGVYIVSVSVPVTQTTYTYSVYGYYSDTGVNGTYSYGNFKSYEFSTTKSLSSLESSFLSDYPIGDYKFNSSKSTLSGYTCNLYFYKGFSQSSYSFHLLVKDLSDGSFIVDTTSNKTAGTTLSGSDYCVANYGDIDTTKYEFKSALLDGNAFLSTDSIYFDMAHTLTVSIGLK